MGIVNVLTLLFLWLIKSVSLHHYLIIGTTLVRLVYVKHYKHLQISTDREAKNPVNCVITSILM